MTAGMNRFARMSAGVAANGVMQFSQVFIRLAEVPILLKLWGATGYGEWLLLTALPMALSFSDGGLTKATQREMTIRAGRGDQVGIDRVFQSTWLMLIAVSVCLMLILWIAVPIVPIGRLLKITTTGSSGVAVVLLAMSAQVLVYFQSSLLYGAFASSGRYAIGILMLALSSLLSFTGELTGAVLKGGAPAAALGMLVGQIIGYSCMLAIFLKTQASPRYGIKHASTGEIKQLLAPSMANLAFPLTDALNTQGLRLVIGLLLGPVALAAFSTIRTLCRSALQPVLSLARTLEPELSLAHGEDKISDARKLFLRMSHAGFWLSIMLCLIVMLIGPPIYSVWAGHQLPLERPVLVVLLAASLFNAMWGIALTVPCSINRHAKVAIWVLLFYGVGTVVMAYLLSRPALGLVGSALAILAADLLMTGIALSFALRQLDISLEGWFAATLRSPVTDVRALYSRGLFELSRRRKAA